MIKAEIFADSGNLAAALGECDRALAGAGGAELDWYLTRSQIQCRLGQFAEAAEGLQRGFELTGSAVLEVESIDAMIDAAQYEAALVKVEAALAETRWQGSWLVRRARIRLGTGEVAAGHQDLAAAIVEMNRRLNPAHPESGLLSERGFAYALLGDLALAKRDLASAKRRGAEPVSLRRLELAIASQR
jgi:tetratricopeptide (TPR) repeat protein